MQTEQIAEVLDSHLLDLAAIAIAADATNACQAVRLGPLEVAGLGLGDAGKCLACFCREALPWRRRR